MDERKRVIEYFQRNGVLIQSEAVDFLIGLGDALDNSRKFLEGFDEKPLNVVFEDVKNFFDGNSDSKPLAGARRSREIKLKIIEDVTGKSSCEGTLSDFTNLFKDRYERLYQLLKKRQEMRNAIPIKNAQRREGDVSVIGIVNEIRRYTSLTI